MPSEIVEKVIDPEAELSNAQRMYKFLAEKCSVARRAEGEPQFAMQEKQMNILTNEMNETMLCIKLACKGQHAIRDTTTKNNIEKSIYDHESMDAELKNEKAQETELDIMNYLAKKRVMNLKKVVPTGVEAQKILENANNRLRRMENRLDIAIKRLSTVNFNIQGIREEINRLLVERHSFNIMWDRTIGKLLRGKAYLMDIFEIATAAFGARDEICRKLDTLKWRGLHGLNRDIAEMQAYQEDLNHLAKLEEFLRLKGTTRVCEADDIQDMKRNEEIIKCEKELNKYEALLHEIFDFAEVKHVRTIETKFESTEIQNHSLFVLICEIMQEIIFVTKELKTLKQNILDMLDMNEARIENQERRITQMTKELNEQRELNYKMFKQKMDADYVIDKVLKGISELVSISMCDVSPLLQLLGNHEKLTRYNMFRFLTILECEIKSLIQVVYGRVKRPPSSTRELTAYATKLIADPYVDVIRPNRIEKLMPYIPCAYCVEDYVMNQVFETPAVPADKEYVETMFHLEDINTKFGIYTLSIPTKIHPMRRNAEI